MNQQTCQQLTEIRFRQTDSMHLQSSEDIFDIPLTNFIILCAMRCIVHIRPRSRCSWLPCKEVEFSMRLRGHRFPAQWVRIMFWSISKAYLDNHHMELPQFRQRKFQQNYSTCAKSTPRLPGRKGPVVHAMCYLNAIKTPSCRLVSYLAKSCMLHTRQAPPMRSASAFCEVKKNRQPRHRPVH